MSKSILGEYKFFSLSTTEHKDASCHKHVVRAYIAHHRDFVGGAYIMRNTGSPAYVAIYQLCMYCGVLATSVLNGLMLKRFKASSLYTFGILLSAAALMAMMFVNSIGIVELGLSGFVLGGLLQVFFWTNRYLLTLNSTNDENRNYFFWA